MKRFWKWHRGSAVHMEIGRKYKEDPLRADREKEKGWSTREKKNKGDYIVVMGTRRSCNI
ncbi:hypothetical protein B0H17DRAFT_286074 [Mycena rosella]|uniref:Uncharacterized protein n=1 Tax=Mycena rosella TaxID=1033263 RepID=A0AAD7CW17_MYCRO|nr:hypothetical protein B0H17DRAFT_286074 [Mycena rosella]